jgi:hypothetical protein
MEKEIGDKELRNQTEDTSLIETLPKTSIDFLDIIVLFWNKLTQEQRINFLDNADLENFLNPKLMWSELDEVQQYAIAKWFLAKVGL